MCVALERAYERCTETPHHFPRPPRPFTLGKDKVLIKLNQEEGAEDEG